MHAVILKPRLETARITPSYVRNLKLTSTPQYPFFCFPEGMFPCHMVVNHGWRENQVKLENFSVKPGHGLTDRLVGVAGRRPGADSEHGAAWKST